MRVGTPRRADLQIGVLRVLDGIDAELELGATNGGQADFKGDSTETGEEEKWQ